MQPETESVVEMTTKPAEETTVAQAATSSGPARPRAPAVKQGKVIVRNLVFDLREKHLQAVFKKYGKIIEVNVPLNPTTN